MELWIRSQDKIKLVKVNYCYIRGWQDHFAIEGETFDSAPIIGEYKTKERALEVLDEIQEHIQKQGQSYILTDEKGQPAGFKEYGNIYEMPEK